MKRLNIIILLLLLLSTPVFAQEYISLFPYISASVFGFGGAFTSVATGFNGMFYNPAGYALPSNNHFSIIDLNVYFNPDFINIAQQTNFFQNLDTEISNSDFISSLLNAKLGMGLSGLPFIGFMRGGLAFAVYDNAGLSASFYPTIAAPDVKITMNAEAGAILGYSFRIGNFLYIGANAKVIARAWADVPTQNLLTLMDSMSSSSGLLPFSVKFGYGYGFDLGAILKLGAFQVGLSFLNLPGIKINYAESNDINQLISGTLENSGTATIPIEINAGVSWNIGTIIPLIMDKAVIAVDVHGVNLLIEDFNEYGFDLSLLGNYFFLGAEFRTLGFLTVRGGLYQGYPAVGFTLNLVILNLSFAYYTKELGMFPGTIPESNMIVTLSFSW